MGFDLHLLCFRHGESATYPRSIAEAIFDRGALRPSELQEVDYPDGRGEIYCDAGVDIHGFMLSHFGGKTIYDRALEIATVTGSLLLWGSGAIKLGVTDDTVLNHLPTQVKSTGEVIALVTTTEELWRAIEAEHEHCEGVKLVFP